MVGIRYGGDEVCAPRVLLRQGSDEIQEQGRRDFIQPELEVGWVCESQWPNRGLQTDSELPQARPTSYISVELRRAAARAWDSTRG